LSIDAIVRRGATGVRVGQLRDGSSTVADHRLIFETIHHAAIGESRTA
jgi:hypothetical protein